MAKRRVRKKQGVIQQSRPDTEPLPETQQHPPEADGSQTKIPLTSESLKELNRQNLRPPLPLLSPSDTSRVAHLATLGGPDLSDLRQYRLPRNFFTVETSLLSCDPPTYTVKPPPLDPLLRKFNIKQTQDSQQLDIQSLRDTLAVRRPSVSLSTVSDDAYKNFRKNMDAAKTSVETGLYLIPTLMGTEYPRNLFALHAPFKAIDPFGYDIPAAQPDLFCGEHPCENLDRSVREALVKHIDPSLSYRMPIIPNFFLEYEDLAIAERDVKSRAQYDGAIGSRAIHSLQNYGNEEPQYDNQPYTFSATYYQGILALYAHHVTKPSNEDGLPEFHMNLIRSIIILDSRESLIEGITAFRNARDEAKKYRDRFIAAANRKRSSQREQVHHQPNQLLNAIQLHNVSSDAVRQMMEFLQQALQQPAVASAVPFHQATQLFQAILQPPAVISGDPIHAESENEQHLNEEPTSMTRAPPSATSTPQGAAPNRIATQHKRLGAPQDTPSQPSVKKTRTGRKY